jgi:hypothetical protein
MLGHNEWYKIFMSPFHLLRVFLFLFRHTAENGILRPFCWALFLGNTQPQLQYISADNPSRPFLPRSIWFSGTIRAILLMGIKRTPLQAPECSLNIAQGKYLSPLKSIPLFLGPYWLFHSLDCSEPLLHYQGRLTASMTLRVPSRQGYGTCTNTRCDTGLLQRNV